MPVQEFVIISHLRSGTHMLRSALDSHPDIRCHGEPFNANSRTLPYPLATSTEEVLSTWALPRVAGKRAVGFVLQIYHPLSLRAFPMIRAHADWADIWDRLAAMPDLRVIFLERHDLLRRHLSQVLAMERGYWHSWDPEAVGRVSHLQPPEREQIGTRPPDTDPIVLDAERLRVDFEEIMGLRERAIGLFARHPCLHVRYESLCADPAVHHRAICDFLSVEYQPLRSATARLETRSLRAAIANYQALAQTFANTPWHEFFDE